MRLSGFDRDCQLLSCLCPLVSVTHDSHFCAKLPAVSPHGRSQFWAVALVVVSISLACRCSSLRGPRHVLCRVETGEVAP